MSAAARPVTSRRRAGRVRAATRPRRGFTLIDLVVIITLLGTLAGSMTVLFGRLAERSASALRTREATTLAESLLNEVRAMPFTFCDPQDARATLAQGAFTGGAGCASVVDAMGAEAGESRYNAANRFDGVSDYQGFTMPGPGCATLCDRNGAPLALNGALAACTAAVTMNAVALPGIAALDANGRPQALRIVVRLSCPGLADTVAEGVRVRHAPRSI